MGAPVSVILGRKSAQVITIDPEASLANAAAALAAYDIGAVVVSSNERDVAGILSERDIVRRIAAEGHSALERRVADVMTRDVTTCDRTTSTDALVTTMTQERIRHLPVVENGSLVGIISIGDIVKWRMEELAEEAHQLEAYVTGSY